MHLSDSIALYRKRTTLYHGRLGHDATLLLATTATYAAHIQLLNIFSEENDDVYNRRLEVARASMAVVNEAGSGDLAYLHVLLGVSASSHCAEQNTLAPLPLMLVNLDTCVRSSGARTSQAKISW